MTKEKSKVKAWHVIAVVVVIAVLWMKFGAQAPVTPSTQEEEEKMMTVNFYDANKQPISQTELLPQMAIVNNIPNVAYITFSANVKNADSSDASMQDIKIKTASVTEPSGEPAQDAAFIAALSFGAGLPYPVTGLVAVPGEVVSFGESDFLDVQNFGVGDYVFGITVSSNYVDINGQPQPMTDKQGSVTLSFNVEPGAAAYSVDFSSSGEIGSTICTSDLVSPDCNSYCPSPSVPSGDYCCAGTTEYYKPRCNVATKVCAFSTKINSGNCGGATCTDVCATDYCVATTLYYGGYCSNPGALPGSQCTYTQQLSAPACGA